MADNSVADEAEAIKSTFGDGFDVLSIVFAFAVCDVFKLQFN